MQRSTSRVASAPDVFPQASKNSPFVPIVPAPKQSSGTFNPDLPNNLYSIDLLMLS
jgi:hypothetical protein